MATTGFDGTGLKQVFNSELGKSYATQREELGTIRFDASWNKYQFMKVREDVDLGASVVADAYSGMDSYETAGLQKAGATFMILSDGGPTSAGFYNGVYIFEDGGITYRIISQEKSYQTGADDDHMKIHLDKPIVTNIADGTPMNEFNPYLVENTDNAKDSVLGIAINDIVKSVAPYSWIQTGGFCMNAKISANTYNIDVGESLACSSTAGVLTGNVQTSLTSYKIVACEDTTKTSGYIPVMIY